MTTQPLGIIEDFLNQLSNEILTFTPRIILAIIIISVAFIILRLVGWAVKKILTLVNVEEFIRRYMGIELPVSFTGLVLAIFYIAVGISATYGLINTLFGEPYVEIANSLLVYGMRILSVVALTVIFFAIFSSFVERIKTENRLKMYLFFIIILLLTAMLIDVTPLSDPVKNALYSGLAIGIGASLSVFSLWFFFHEYLDRYFRRTGEKKMDSKS